MMRYPGCAVLGGWLLAMAGGHPGSVLAEEIPTTAAEVVDRASLKAFVLHGKARVEALESLIEVVTLHDTLRTSPGGTRARTG